MKEGPGEEGGHLPFGDFNLYDFVLLHEGRQPCKALPPAAAHSQQQRVTQR